MPDRNVAQFSGKCLAELFCDFGIRCRLEPVLEKKGIALRR